MTNLHLPKAFKDLEPYLSWALPTESGRNSKRLQSSMKDIGRFYDVMTERAEAALVHLDTFALDKLPEAEKNLLNLTLSLAEVANAIELFKTEPGVIGGFPAERFVPEHGDKDALLTLT